MIKCVAANSKRIAVVWGHIARRNRVRSGRMATTMLFQSYKKKFTR